MSAKETLNHRRGVLASAEVLRLVESIIGRALDVDERADCSGFSDSSIGLSRLKRWLESPAFSERQAFEHFLLSRGLTEAAFIHRLGLTPPIVSGSQDIPSWNAALVETPWHDEDEEQEAGPGGYLSLVHPLLVESEARLRSVVDMLNGASKRPLFEPTTLAPLVDSLREQLLLVIIKPLTLELNAARLTGTLVGDTPAARFRCFVKSLRHQEIREQLYVQYPVLLKHCLRICDQWVDSIREFLRRTADDMPFLTRMFGVGERLLSAQFASSDAHQDGRRVVIACFPSGRKLVYKPRPMKAALRFQELLGWLNAKGLNPELRTIRIFDRGRYGWGEFVDTCACDSPSDVAIFYQRMGALLAVLHTMRATDAHFENLIACGSYPVLVDFETALRPRLFGDSAHSENSPCRNAAAESVLAVGLLPSPVRVAGQWIDMSGLGARPDQPTPLQTMGFDASGTDAMRITKVQFSIGTSSHLPILDGKFYTASENIEPLVAGFHAAYCLIKDHSRELLSPSGPVSAFGDCEVRVLLRPTATYASLLQESHHPMALSDGTEADMVLSQIWSRATSNRVWRDSVKHEFAQLRRGDIPFFSCCASGTTIASGRGHRIESIMSMSGMDCVRERLAMMSEADLRLQEWIIRASMASLDQASVNAPHLVNSLESDGSVASMAMAALLSTCVAEDNRASWLTLAPMTGGHGATLDHRIAEVGIELYDGLAGIAFFLFALAKHANNESAFKLGCAVLNDLDWKIDEQSEAHGFGAFSGLSGILYSYAHIARWFPKKSADLQQKAGFLLSLIALRLDKETKCDLLSGRAGAILCLVAAYDVWADRRYLDLAVRCGKELNGWLNRSRHDPATGLNLPYKRGMSHGYAGVAMALAVLGAATGEELFTIAATDLTRLEASFIAKGGWTDPGDQHHTGQATWCHGAPGIAMARLVTLGKVYEPWIERDARNALAQCLAAAQPDNESLCHGALGNLDALLHAVAAFPGDRFWVEEVHRAASSLGSTMASRGLRCARPNYVAVPGLMTGVAGIGYEMIRVANPALFPSILTLSSPGC